MRILITGCCGFVGAWLARQFKEGWENVELIGLDNFIRPGTEINRGKLAGLGVDVRHGDARVAGDMMNLPAADWVIEAAANPSVLAGVDGKSDSRQVLDHNLLSTINTLEYCKKHGAGFALLSSSRVYSIAALSGLRVEAAGKRYEVKPPGEWPAGLSSEGIAEEFSTEAPVSLYGASKLASEILALEYGAAFDFPVWVNRCGVLAGAGQFGTAEQGIFSYWLHAHRARRPLRYIGFDGMGRQLRDAFHPRDLARLLMKQMREGRGGGRRLYTAGGGRGNALSLAELSDWCDTRFGAHAVASDQRPRRYDLPWVVMDSAKARNDFHWEAELGMEELLEEIALHAEANPRWLELCQA